VGERAQLKKKKKKKKKTTTTKDMVQVCFVLDLRSLSPPFLRDVKQVKPNLDVLSLFNCKFSFLIAV
jgi:hypothetical protein